MFCGKFLVARGFPSRVDTHVRKFPGRLAEFSRFRIDAPHAFFYAHGDTPTMTGGGSPCLQILVAVPDGCLFRDHDAIHACPADQTRPKYLHPAAAHTSTQCSDVGVASPLTQARDIPSGAGAGLDRHAPRQRDARLAYPSRAIHGIDTGAHQSAPSHLAGIGQWRGGLVRMDRRPFGKSAARGARPAAEGRNACGRLSP